MVEDLLWAAIIVVFVALAAYHLGSDVLRRRRVRVLRQTGEFGPRSPDVDAILERANTLTASESVELAHARRAAEGAAPKPWRAARSRAFANERDIHALAAAGAGRDAAMRRIGILAASSGLDARLGADVAEAVAETTGTVAARDRLDPEDVKLLTRAWRTAVGPLAAGPRSSRLASSQRPARPPTR